MLMCEIGILDFSLRRILMERFTLIISNKCRQITESTGRDQDQRYLECKANADNPLSYRWRKR